MRTTTEMDRRVVRAQALFTSGLQPSQVPTCGQIHQAIRAALRRYGSTGCAAQVAQEYGDHPSEAVNRMLWVLETLADEYPVANDPAMHELASTKPASRRAI